MVPNKRQYFLSFFFFLSYPMKQNENKKNNKNYERKETKKNY